MHKYAAYRTPNKWAGHSQLYRGNIGGAIAHIGRVREGKREGKRGRNGEGKKGEGKGGRKRGDEDQNGAERKRERASEG
jgi:hypothetical protein